MGVRHYIIDFGHGVYLALVEKDVLLFENQKTFQFVSTDDFTYVYAVKMTGHAKRKL